MSKTKTVRTKTPATLTEESLARGVAHLSRRDADLARVVREHGLPQMWERAPGFPTLVHIMLEQQVSLASAKAAYDRLLAVASPLTPQSLLRLDDAALRAAYFSRQKALYVRRLAELIVAGELDLDGLADKPDDEARAELMKVKGIGPWTADIYLLRALLRPDVWPAGDLALLIAAQRVKGLETRPTHIELTELAEAWRPWRAVAARILWQFYLHAPRAR